MRRPRRQRGARRARARGSPSAFSARARSAGARTGALLRKLPLVRSLFRKPPRRCASRRPSLGVSADSTRPGTSSARRRSSRPSTRTGDPEADRRKSSSGSKISEAYEGPRRSRTRAARATFEGRSWGTRPRDFVKLDARAPSRPQGSRSPSIGAPSRRAHGGPAGTIGGGRGRGLHGRAPTQVLRLPTYKSRRAGSATGAEEANAEERREGTRRGASTCAAGRPRERILGN